MQFAIRPNIRNHTILSRDSVIKQVARIVGPDHQVNLKEYDLLIVVEVYKVCCATKGPGDQRQLTTLFRTSVASVSLTRASIP